MATLRALYLHPLKSAAALQVPQAAVHARGLQHDRRWMAVDADGNFLSGRRLPSLVRIRAVPLPGGLALDAPDHPGLEVATPAPQAPRRRVVVWKSVVDAACAGDAAAGWLSDVLQQPARLVFMDARAQRSLEVGGRAEPLSLADAAPVMLVSQAALDALNERLPTPMPMQRFRPNLVVDGVAAHAEDAWRRVQVGAVEFELVKPCVRCVFTTVDPVTGSADPGGEPLRTLLGYRRGPRGVQFGQLLVPRGRGTLRQGDAVRVLD
jgi:uncharacterized protein